MDDNDSRDVLAALANIEKLLEKILDELSKLRRER